MSWKKLEPGTAHACTVMDVDPETKKAWECGKPATHVSECDSPDDPDVWVWACEECFKGYLNATAQRDQEAAFTEEHGYPSYWGVIWGLGAIGVVVRRLARLRKLDAPEIIIKLERAMLTKRVGYLRAYLKAHPEERRAAR